MLLIVDKMSGDRSEGFEMGTRVWMRRTFIDRILDIFFRA